MLQNSYFNRLLSDDPVIRNSKIKKKRKGLIIKILSGGS